MEKVVMFEKSNDMERELKAEFTTGKIQSFLDFDSDEPIILILDWSALNIAGVLFQKQEGIEPFIGRWVLGQEVQLF